MIVDEKPHRFASIDFEMSSDRADSAGKCPYGRWYNVRVHGVDLAAHVNVFVCACVCETLSSSLQVADIYRIVN